MTYWDIDTAGVVAVLTNVSVPAEAMGTSLLGLEAAISAAATATQSGAIGEAIQAYFEHEEGPRIQGINARITAASEGVVAATHAYVAGDLEMASASQRAAYEQVFSPASEFTPAGSHLTATTY